MQKLWDDNALFVYKILDGQVRLVGGCVRDYLLHKPFKDRDMATILTPEQVVERLKEHHIPYLEIGRAFGTIVAKIKGIPFEITTLRKDIETDGRHAVVGFTKSWGTDARRRDFTVNALYADVHGKIYDYVQGLEDLKKRHIRFVGDPKRRMQEDYLRVLRYFRFWAQMGEKTVDLKIQKCLPEIIPYLSSLSHDRRREEMFKIVTGPRAKSVLKMMQKLGVLTKSLQEIRFSKRQKKVVAQRGLEKMLETFNFSEYKREKGGKDGKIEK